MKLYESNGQYFAEVDCNEWAPESALRKVNKGGGNRLKYKFTNYFEIDWVKFYRSTPWLPTSACVGGGFMGSSYAGLRCVGGCEDGSFLVVRDTDEEAVKVFLRGNIVYPGVDARDFKSNE